MNFFTITEGYRTAYIAAAIIAREEEIFSYDLNLENYMRVLAELPKGDCPAHLKKGQPKNTEQAIEQSDYLFRDEVRGRLLAEQIERRKSERVYQALLAQIPEEGLADAIAAAQKERA